MNQIALHKNEKTAGSLTDLELPPSPSPRSSKKVGALSNRWTLTTTTTVNVMELPIEISTTGFLSDLPCFKRKDLAVNATDYEDIRQRSYGRKHFKWDFKLWDIIASTTMKLFRANWFIIFTQLRKPRNWHESAFLYNIFCIKPLLLG